MEEEDDDKENAGKNAVAGTSTIECNVAQRTLEPGASSTIIHVLRMQRMQWSEGRGVMVQDGVLACLWTACGRKERSSRLRAG